MKVEWPTGVPQASDKDLAKLSNTEGVRTHFICVQGLRPLKDSVFEVFEGESFRETLLTSSAVIKWDGLAFGAFPGCVTGQWCTQRVGGGQLLKNTC